MLNDILRSQGIRKEYYLDFVYPSKSNSKEMKPKIKLARNIISLGWMRSQGKLHFNEWERNMGTVIMQSGINHNPLDYIGKRRTGRSTLTIQYAVEQMVKGIDVVVMLRSEVYRGYYYNLVKYEFKSIGGYILSKNTFRGKITEGSISFLSYNNTEKLRGLEKVNVLLDHSTLDMIINRQTNRQIKSIKNRPMYRVNITQETKGF